MSDYSISTQEEQIVVTVSSPSAPTIIQVATVQAGPSGRIASVQAQTLAPGSAATVANTGTQEVAALTFGIPQGIQGVKGDKGDTGDPFSNIDGGNASSVYGGIEPIDGGGA